MARLVSEQKLGYYPVSPHTIRLIAQELSGTGAILDPCAGKGDALHQLGELLGVPPEKRYGVELHEDRARECASKGGPTLWASFLSMFATSKSFSLAWVNPPYSGELSDSSCRTEWEFCKEAWNLLVPGGIMVLHMPDTEMEDWRFCCLFSDVHKVFLPHGCKPYGESLLVGKRREKEVGAWETTEVKEVRSMPKWALPPSEGPKTFKKLAPTPEELKKALDKSPLLKVFQAPPERKKLRPILPLGKGHLALLLAAGHLDGVIEGDEPHVVRGVAFKEQYVSKQETVEDDKGNTTTTTVRSEKIVLNVRTATQDGIIRTFK